MGKLAGRRVTFHAPARMGAIAASLAAAAALLLPSTALASTEIGSAQGSLDCTVPGFDSVQVTSSSDSYAIPTGGTFITSWSVLAGPDTGPVGLEVWQPAAPPSYTLIASDLGETITADSLNTFTLDKPIAVTAGDLIGLRVDGPFMCESLILNQDGSPSTGDTAGFAFGTTALGGTAVMSIFTGFQLNIAATVDVASPPPPPPTPTSTAQCKHGGWQGLTDSKGTLFKNQGDCVSFVATQGTNPAAG